MPDPDMSVWTGRTDEADGPWALRWHQMVRPLTADCQPGIALIGFACDEGVRRNRGRVGAKDGPRAIRSALANLAWHQKRLVYDAGDVRCDDGDMEASQSRLAGVVAGAIRGGHRPIILGGGHETAWGTFQGIVAAKPEATVGVINIDAHLDLRADEPANSGTPFYQIARWCSENGRPFRYLCVGAAQASNTAALFQRLAELGGATVPDFAFNPSRNLINLIDDAIEELVPAVDVVHLSLDLDVLPAATMPAVSAPAGRGVPLDWIKVLVRDIIRTRGKTVAADLVEFNPALDPDGNAARVAAGLAWDIGTWWSKV